MRGDMELHPHDLMFYLSPMYSAAAIKYFINKVIYMTDSYFTKPANLSDAAFFAVLYIGITAGTLSHIYTEKHQYDRNCRLFLRCTLTLAAIIDLAVTALLIVALQYPV